MGKLLLTDGTDLEKKGTEFIGWGYHSSRYYPYAIEQAMYSTYKEALNEVKKIQAETNMPMAEIMHKELARDLETSDYTKWGIDPLASEPQIPASTKRKTHKSFCCLCDFASDLVACSMTERQEHVEDNRCIYAMRNKKRVSVVRGGVVEMNRKTYRRKLNGDLGEEVKLERRNQLLMYSITGKHD